MKNSKVVSFLSPFKVAQAGNLWTLPRTRTKALNVHKEREDRRGVKQGSCLLPTVNLNKNTFPKKDLKDFDT